MVQFVEAVKELQKIADHTFVWLAPRNTELLEPTPAGLARLAGALARVARETGAPIIDFTTAPGIGPTDFLDATHLDEHGGRRKSSKLLADRVATLLGAAELPTPADAESVAPHDRLADELLAVPCAGPMRGRIESCIRERHLDAADMPRKLL